jgi:hypothetical protein
MTNTRPSLLERAAEIYDFASGLPAVPANDLPPRRVRPVPPAPRAVPQPEPQAVQPVQQAGTAVRASRSRRPAGAGRTRFRRRSGIARRTREATASRRQ